MIYEYQARIGNYSYSGMFQGLSEWNMEWGFFFNAFLSVMKYKQAIFIFFFIFGKQFLYSFFSKHWLRVIQFATFDAIFDHFIFTSNRPVRCTLLFFFKFVCVLISSIIIVMQENS